MLRSYSPVGEFPPITALHAAAWDRMNQRDHELETGAWQVFLCPENRQHQWHVLCCKYCLSCGNRVSIERRINAARATELRVILPAGRCPGC